MQQSTGYKIPTDYWLVFSVCASLVAIAFIFDSPQEIARGFLLITTSRSVLVTDYVALGGIGAGLVNAALSGLFYLVLLVAYKTHVNGRVILALFLTIGFSLFGKNLANMLPIFFGVLLYAKAFDVKFSNLLVPAMVSGTVGPIVSEIAFMYGDISPLRIALAFAAGLFIGFIFPVVMEASKAMHKGFCLYNGGVAGGFIATFFVGLLRSLGIQPAPEAYWDTEHTVILASFAYLLGAGLVAYGFIHDKPAGAVEKYKHLLKESDEIDNDYRTKYGKTCYINIGALCIVSTSLMMLLQIPINGPILGGILTLVGFAAGGKHLRNVIPILIGSVIAVNFNYYDMGSPSNALAILFSTGLAPIAGKFGWKWGIVTGFVHVSVAIIVGNLNGGMNLYNNGFAGGFVALIMVPLILFFNDLFKQFFKKSHLSGED
ncbi:MAG: DUF1576 domain-containing protein [Spirochaetes bacterium]|nr:DUF1576 domain-containing protein [Spirochaetota bacterium]